MSAKKYEISKWTLFTDKFMSKFITFGGLSVIFAVLLILVFIGLEVIPLLSEAKVSKVETIELPAVEKEAITVDEWSTMPGLVTKDSIYFVNLEKEKKVIREEFQRDGDYKITAVSYNQETQSIIVGNEHGKFSVIKINYSKKFLDAYENGRQLSETVYNLEQLPYLDIAGQEGKIVEIQYAETEEKKLVSGIIEIDGKKKLFCVTLEQEVDLFGGTSGEVKVGKRIDLSEFIKGNITKLELSSQADSLLVASDTGEVFSFRTQEGEITYNQTFKPFKNETEKTVSSMHFLFGSKTVIFSNKEGRVVGWSLYKPDKELPLGFGLTKPNFDNLEGAATFFTKSLRNKAFLTGAGKNITLYYSTNESINWQEELDYEVEHSIISSKYNSIFLTDNQNKLHHYYLDDPHPEASVRTYFAPLWYEGQAEPRYLWESVGGTEEKEKFLSMMPLVFGTFKATFYALLFAIPIALLAAIYTSQFLPPSWKTIIKPLMEVMASLPSVIIGFLAALCFAPMVEDKFPSIMMVLLLTPLSALAMGSLWNNLPPKLRFKCAPGTEFLFFLPVLIFVAWFGWKLGPIVESFLFVVKDSQGNEIANFAFWWNKQIGLEYSQKNAMIVGFAMGFAVIPIIFTIAEDSLSNVPKAMTSASLALGASRWQTTWKVIVPTASAGIFSACMIGLGRAVGETMIVLCAAGGIGVMDMNIFNGMRTLSLNLATELPEAAKNGTLYRSLFLGALILFVLTFIINTVAEIIRQHIRNKYKTI